MYNVIWDRVYDVYVMQPAIISILKPLFVFYNKTITMLTFSINKYNFIV